MPVIEQPLEVTDPPRRGLDLDTAGYTSRDLPLIRTTPTGTQSDPRKRKAKDGVSVQHTVLSQLSRLTGWPTSLVEQKLSPKWGPRLLSDGPPANKIASAVLRLSGLTWRGTPPDPNDGHFEKDGIVLIPSGTRLFQDLLKDDLPGAEAEFELQYQRRLREAQTVESTWERTRPEWFPAEELQRWSRAYVSSHVVKHPLLPWAQTFELHKPLQVSVRKRTCHVKPSAHDIESLWEAPALRGSPEKSLKARLQSTLARRIGAKLERTLVAFLDAQSEALGHLEGLSKEAQVHELERSYLEEFSQNQGFGLRNIAQRALARAESRGRLQQDEQRRQQAALRCADDLPRELKDFYPLARSLSRKITFIMGETNSGKTYQALKCLREAHSGVYLGPLRLLALEVHETLTEQGVPNSLITGELVIETPGASHSAATIEMLDTATPVDVVVVDEVQMLSDRDRGSAWLAAVLGAPARHVVLVGSPSALPLVRKLAEHTQEPLEVQRLERLAPLEVLEQPSSLKALDDGTALIVFSRKDALGLAAHLRERTQKKVAVIYGALSPEVRREQARQFREGEASYLVATDAIGMGLNLPIRTVLFTTLEKWDGRQRRLLRAPLLQQIAGRAGRFGLHERGAAGALDHKTLNQVRSLWGQKLPELAGKVQIALSRPLAHTIAKHTGSESLAATLAFFSSQLSWPTWVSPAVTEEQQAMAGFLDGIRLSLDQRVGLLNAPAFHASRINPHFYHMVETIRDQTPFSREFAPLRGHEGLDTLEQEVRSSTLYCWMHYRHPALFPLIEVAQAHLSELNQAITQALERQTGRRCGECGRPLAWNHAYRICEECYHGGRHQDDWRY